MYLCDLCRSSQAPVILSQYFKNGIDDALQNKILKIPLDQNGAVIGGPGSGKTLMASIRAKQASVKYDRVLLLVYNRPLRQLFNLDQGNFPFDAKTYHSWMGFFYKNFFHQKDIPHIGSDKFQLDWDKISKDFEHVDYCYDYVVVDEGQDFPHELLRILKKISKRIMILFDPGQDIWSNLEEDDDKKRDFDIVQRAKEKTADLLDLLGIAESDAVRLETNFRNPKSIYEIASKFSSDEEFDTRMNCQNTPGTSPIVYYKPGFDEYSWESIWDIVVKYVNDNPEKKVGVVLKKIIYGNRAFEALSKRLGQQNVFLYKWKPFCFEEIDLNRQVVLLSLNTVKGLGFDSVFLVYVNGREMDTAGEKALLMRKYYVASTRAKTFLGVFCSATQAQARKFFGDLQYSYRSISSQ